MASGAARMLEPVAEAATGSLLRRALSERRVRRQTETGGKNASVVLADADVEPAAPGFRFNTRLKTAAVRFAW